MNSVAKRSRRVRAASILVRQLQRRTARTAARSEGDIYRMFASLGVAVARELPKHDTSFLETQKDAAGDNEEFRARLISLALNIVDSDNVTDAIKQAVKVLATHFHILYETIGEATWQEVSGFLEVAMEWNLEDPAEQEILKIGKARARGYDIGKALTDETRRVLAEGRARGEGVADLARQLREEVGKKRAATIARTEAKYAQNVSSIRAYKQSEVVTGLIAFDNQTAFNDADCRERNGQIFSFEEAHTLTDSEHPNGTLSWGPDTSGAAPTSETGRPAPASQTRLNVGRTRGQPNPSPE